jgi:cation:H+ antiporter
MLVFAGWLGVAVVSTAIIFWGSSWLEASSEKLSVYYELPEIVQGAVVVAVGSSFPELSTTVLSTLIHGEFELGVAAIVGSALFNILVIPAVAGLVGETQLESNRDLVYKEAQFYMIAVAVLMLTFSFGAIYNPVPDTESIKGNLTRELALIPVGLYLLYVFVQYQDTMDFQPDVDAGDIRVGRAWVRMLASLVIILVGVEGLVRSAVRFGDILETPSFLWGVTVVAAGTSVPDAFVSVNAAKEGRAITSVANVLGSNIFDLLVCIPAGVLLAGMTTVNFSVAAPMMGVLTFATIVLFLMMRTGMLLSEGESWGLLVLYVVFTVWIGAESFGLLDTVPGIPPSTGGATH